MHSVYTITEQGTIGELVTDLDEENAEYVFCSECDWNAYDWENET